MNYIVETQRELEEARKIAGQKWKDRAGAIYNSTIKPTGKYLGAGGVIGGVAGLALGGPIGAVLGALVGKNAKEIVKAGGQGIDAYVKASLYEDIDSDAAHASTAPTYDAGGLWTKAKNAGRWAGAGVQNMAGRVSNVAENSGRYKKLEDLAKEASESEGERISPERMYHAIKDKKEKRKVDKLIKDKKQEVLKNVRVYRATGDPAFEARANQSMSEFKDLLLDNNVTDPEEYMWLGLL